MATTGFVLWPSNADHATVVSDFTNLLNVSVADSSTFATKSYSGTGAAHGTDYGTFGLDALIPVGATINAGANSVQLRIQRKKTTATGTYLVHLQGKVGATVLADHSAAVTGLLVVDTYDITGDRAWVRSDFLDGTFYARALAECTVYGGSPTTVDVNSLYVSVDYTVPVAAVAHGLTTVGAG